jgi:hypothetical protein
MPAFDLPPVLWMPSRPALVRAAPSEEIARASALPGMSGGALAWPGPAQLEYRTATSSTSNAGAYTFNGVDIGAERADRVVLVWGFATGGGAISAELDDIAMTQVIDLFDGKLFRLAKPAGTTAKVEIILASGTAQNCAIAVWRLFGHQSATPHATSASFGSASTRTADAPAVNVPAGGVAIFVNSRFGPGAVSWSNATERFDSTLETNFSSSAADFANATGAAINSHTATATFTSSSFGGWGAASWR